MTSMKRALVAAATFSALSLGAANVLAEPHRNNPNDKNVAGKIEDGVYTMNGRRLAQVTTVGDVGELASKFNKWAAGSLDIKGLKPEELATLRDSAIRAISILRKEVKNDPWEAQVNTEFKGKVRQLNTFLGDLKGSAIPKKVEEQPREFGIAENLDKYVIPMRLTPPLQYLARNYHMGIFLGEIKANDMMLEAFNLRGTADADSKAFLSRAVQSYLSGKPTGEDAKALGSMAESTINHQSDLYRRLSQKDASGKSLLDRLNSGDASAVSDLFKQGIIQGVLNPNTGMIVARRLPFDFKEYAASLKLQFRAPKGWGEFQKQIDGLAGTESFHFLGFDLGFEFAAIRSFLELQSLTPGAVKLPPGLLQSTSGYNAEGVLALNFGGKVGTRIWRMSGLLSGGYNSVDFMLPSDLVQNQGVVYFTGKGGLEKTDRTVRFRGMYLGQQSLTVEDLGRAGQVPHSLKVAVTAGHVGTDMAGNYLAEASLLKEWGTGRWHLQLGADARVFWALRAMEEEVQRAWLAGTGANVALDTRLLKKNEYWRVGGLAGAHYQFFQGFANEEGKKQPTHMITLDLGGRVSWKDFSFSAIYGRTFNVGQINKDINTFMANITIPIGAQRKPGK